MQTETLAAFAHNAAHRVEQEVGEDAQARCALALVAEAGLLTHTVPARWGGASHPGVDESAVSVRILCSLRNVLSFASGMLDVMFVEQGLGSYPLALGGQGEWVREVLAEVMRGERVAAFALTETGAGSDLSAVATHAQHDADGWRLSGSKTFITNAGIADFYTVLARTSGQPGEREGLSMFFVPADQGGLQVERFEVMAPHPIGTLTFEDVRVEPQWLLGTLGGGLELALATLGRFRTSVAAAANGFSRRALHESMAHLERRQQFGRPLSSFQGLRFDLAEMDARLAAGELLVREAAEAIDQGMEASTEVARAKWWCTENASWICDRAVQHLGGLGVQRGQVVERLYREVRALRIYEGTSEVQKLILAKNALERHRKENPLG
ncbi:MAG: acyl-CoA dehydrogenase [Planctomycetes bacterium]|nr:acyl-CoA dehydrogenase [Planctomycetota bacterium]MCB9909705.1 acyl-CoA dehydrogenase [Planctomycetota bacterium]MCB9911806.1 acyl-CoA dehydrogenase [Planctomycetota bacterium]HPF14064.1 acyl-CoA dehydrogenase [Planctomycetota bacterium]HRV79919.1 acyl-CoA dehydrogenase [Planctomycetota bacterium]